MNEQPVVFIDSGIGGLPYLSWFTGALPGENLVYCADTGHFPYGKRSSGEVRELVLSLVGRISDLFSPKLVVVACNTASVSALSALRERFTMPFVGVVPAVKPAAVLTRKKTIGLMATNRTVEEVYTENLIHDFAGDCRIIRYADGDIVEFVENRLLDAEPEERTAVARRAAVSLAEVDVVVLACTHFIHLRADLEREFGPQVEIVDSVEGVGKQALRLVQGLGERKGPGNTACLYTTGSPEQKDLYRRHAEKFGLCYRGSLI